MAIKLFIVLTYPATLCKREGTLSRNINELFHVVTQTTHIDIQCIVPFWNPKCIWTREFQIRREEFSRCSLKKQWTNVWCTQLTVTSGQLWFVIIAIVFCLLLLLIVTVLFLSIYLSYIQTTVYLPSSPPTPSFFSLLLLPNPSSSELTQKGAGLPGASAKHGIYGKAAIRSSTSPVFRIGKAIQYEE